MIPDTFHPPLHAIHTFRRLVAGTDLVVVEEIFRPHCTGERFGIMTFPLREFPAPVQMDGLFPVQWLLAAGHSVLEAEKSHHEQCQIHGSGGAAPNGVSCCGINGPIPTISG